MKNMGLGEGGLLVTEEQTTWGAQSPISADVSDNAQKCFQQYYL